jgi:hypothetical protein
MPFELGLFLGAKKFGCKIQVVKKTLIFHREAHRYQSFISDISGQDIHAHLAAWLRREANDQKVPRGRAMRASLPGFKKI